jgi:ATP-dependent DNA ligase
MYAQHIESQGCKLFETTCGMDLEGIVAKRKDSLYHPSVRWLKIKNTNYSQAEGRRELFQKRSASVRSNRRLRPR